MVVCVLLINKMLKNVRDTMINGKIKNSTLFRFSSGLIGIQFVWALIIANMSGIFALFQAKDSELGLLWIAPSIIGLIFPLLIGYLSDRTSTFLGKRLPYIIIGTAITTITIICWSLVSSLMMAAIMLCVFMAGINTTQQPFRPLVSDIVSKNQYTSFYAIQTVMIGIGATLAFIMPWFLKRYMITNIHINNVPAPIMFSFFIGAIVLTASVVWSLIAIKPYLLTSTQKKDQGTIQYSKQITHAKNTIVKIFTAQFFIWFGTFSFLIYLTPAIRQIIFHGYPTLIDPSLIEQCTIITGLVSAAYTLVSIIFAYLIPILNRRISRKIILTLSLLLGGISLGLICLIHRELYLFVLMTGIGIAWAAFNSIPFAILSNCAPKEKVGFYMGLSNVFICLPQIVVSLLIGSILKKFLKGNTVELMLLAGICYIVAAIFIQLIHDTETCKVRE